MAKEIQEKKESKRYRVQLRPGFVIPQYKGQPKTGILYIRSGYQFTDTYGEGQSYHIVSESELEKFKMAKNQQFVNSPLEYQIDPNLVIEEVK